MTPKHKSDALALIMKSAREIEQICIAYNFEALLHLSRMTIMESAILDGKMLQTIPCKADIPVDPDT